MGMDVYADNPKDPENDYFRANVWSWRPIHMFMSESCSHIYGEEIDNHMSYNDGRGIPGDLVEQCADEMQKTFDSLKEDVPQYIEEVVTEEGETVEVLKPVEDPEWSHMYRIPLWRLQEWVNFVRNSGGFRVH